MSSPLDQFRGRSWSDMVIRQKLNGNETLLSEDNSYDLLRCRRCRRVVKAGYVDIHLKKCAQYHANLPPKNPAPGKLVMAKYYYDVLPIDNSHNSFLSSSSSRVASEPPHKKRKVTKSHCHAKKNSSAPLDAESDIPIILPPAMRNKNRSKKRHTSIYRDLFHGLRSHPESNNSTTTSATTTTKKRHKSIKKKLKLRLNRPSSKSTPPTSDSSKSNSDMMRNQKIEREKGHHRPSRSSTITSSSSHSSQSHHSSLPLTTAWEREEELITEGIKSECSINYVTYHQFWNQYAKALDRYAVECTTRANAQCIKLMEAQISHYSKHSFRPVIKHLLERNHYKQGGREFEDYQALQELVGVSYNMPGRFSNSIHPPRGKSASFRAFVDEGKYQANLQREEHDFWFKSQPLSPLRYISADLHRKYVKMQQKVWTARQLQLIQRQKQEIQKKKKAQQAQQQQQGYIPIPLINKMNKNTVNAPSASPGAPILSRKPPQYNHGGYRNGSNTTALNGTMQHNVTYSQRPITPINRSRIASHSTYNGHANNGETVAVGLQTQRSYGAHSVNSQQSHTSIISQRGLNPYAQQQSSSTAMNGNTIHSASSNRSSQASVQSQLPQAQYPSYPAIANVPSPFANTPPANANTIRNVNMATTMGYVQPSMTRGGNYRNNGHVIRGVPPQQAQRPLMRGASYDTNQSSHYNASPSDTAITVSSTSYPNASAQPPLPLNTHINTNQNVNNNPSPQSINSNHTSYTGISQRSATPITPMTMTYPTRTNTIYPPSANGLILPPPNGLQRGNTNDAEMYMPSIGC